MSESLNFKDAMISVICTELIQTSVSSEKTVIPRFKTRLSIKNEEL